jgi:hypothetical protein
MALSARTPVNADTNKFIPELWSQKVIDTMQNQLVCMDAVDFKGWQIGLKKGDTINIPATSHVTATEIVVGTRAASLDPAAASPGYVQLVMTYWWEAPIDVDTMTVAQSQVDWPAIAQAEAAYAIDKKIDTSIGVLFSALNGGSVYGADGQTLTDDILLYLKQTLDEADVPLDSNRSLVVDPSGVVDILKIDKFVAATYAANTGAIKNGIVGTTPIYGCTVRVTNNLTAATTGSYGCMLHSGAIAGAIQVQSPWEKKFEELHQIRYQAEALWGVIETRDNFGIPFYTRKS